MADDFLEQPPVFLPKKMARKQESKSFPFMKVGQGVDSAARKNGKTTLPVAHNGSRAMARNPKALLEHPKFAPKRSLRHEGKSLNPQNYQYNLKPPKINEASPVVLYQEKDIIVYLFDQPNGKYRVVEVANGVMRRSIEYLSGPHAAMRYEKSTITWERQHEAKRK